MSEAVDYGIDPDGVAYTAERLRRAVLTLAVLSEGGGSSSSSWPKIVRDWKDAYGYHAPRARRFEPTPRDMDEYLEAYDWLTWLTRQHQGKRDYQIIVAKAFGSPTWKLAQRYGKSDRTIQRWYEGAVTAIWCQFQPAPQNTLENV